MRSLDELAKELQRYKRIFDMLSLGTHGLTKEEENLEEEDDHGKESDLDTEEKIQKSNYSRISVDWSTKNFVGSSRCPQSSQGLLYHK